MERRMRAIMTMMLSIDTIYNSNGSSHTSHQHGTTAHQNQIKASNSKSSSIPHDWVTYVDTLYQEEERRRQKQMERQQSA